MVRAFGRKFSQPEYSRLEEGSIEAVGSEGRRRKGHHKAAKRQSLGVDGRSLFDLEGDGDRDKAGRGQGGEQTWRGGGELHFRHFLLEVCIDVDVNKTDSIFVCLLLFFHAENSDLTRLSQYQSLS